MQVVYTHCAGLDVHKKTVTACVITPNQKGGWNREVRTFETHTNSLLNMQGLVIKFWLYPSSDGKYRGILATSIQYTGKQLGGDVS